MAFLSKLFGKKTRLEPIDLALVGADMHAHLLPGIDDGAATMDDSIELISGLHELGYRKLVATPHVMSDYYRNTPEIILGKLAEVREAIAAEGIDVELHAAAEYYLDHEFTEMIGRDQLLTFGDNYVLFELPFIAEPQMLNEVIFSLQTNGYKAVLAHVERYTFWHQSYEKYQELADKGVVLQLNLNSLTGHYSPQVKKIGERLVADGLISMLGTDTHHMHHIELLTRARSEPALHQLINSGKLLNPTL